MLTRVLQRRGDSPRWDAYLYAVYGSSLTYPVDLGQFTWFYWAAPVHDVEAFPIYVGPSHDATAYVAHFAPLGFTVQRQGVRAPIERAGQLWVEVMREDKSPMWESSKAGFWYYEARGSGMWIDLGRTLDYSCSMPQKEQRWPESFATPERVKAYEETCAALGNIPPQSRAALFLNGTKVAGRHRNKESAWLRVVAKSDWYFGDHHRMHGFDTVVRYFGIDIDWFKMGSAARREVIDIRQSRTSCNFSGDSRRMCGDPERCCSCTGGDTLWLHTRRGWPEAPGWPQAEGTPSACACDEGFRIHTSGYKYSGFLNCGSESPPLLKLLRGAGSLGGQGPFELADAHHHGPRPVALDGSHHSRLSLLLEGTAHCANESAGKFVRKHIPNLVRLETTSCRAACGDKASNAGFSHKCAWTRFWWPPQEAAVHAARIGRIEVSDA